MDNDCAGELVCEEGACVEPARPAPATPNPVSERFGDAPPRPMTFEAHASEEDDGPRDRRKLKGKRHSTGMMVTGIVLTSFAPIGLIVGTAGMMGGRSEFFLVGWGSAAVLAGVGIPLIVIGGRRKPITTGYALPWVAPQSAGLQLRFEL
jgi:hypothetical protein